MAPQGGSEKADSRRKSLARRLGSSARKTLSLTFFTRSKDNVDTLTLERSGDEEETATSPTTRRLGSGATPKRLSAFSRFGQALGLTGSAKEPAGAGRYDMGLVSLDSTFDEPRDRKSVV